MQPIAPYKGSFAATRRQALAGLEAFMPAVADYAKQRNHVLEGHGNVSRLSPAIAHGLLLQDECVQQVLQCYTATQAAMFIKELYWRSYWKSWLGLRPQVWSDYKKRLAALQTGPEYAQTRLRAARCTQGHAAVDIMNYFAAELIANGYLHNHARMWFAGWWIHVERLPWELGADFFMRHLLDGDAASNTLSWRWVAGLHTAGKTYLPRRQNLEKYLPEALLRRYCRGLELLEDPQELVLPQDMPQFVEPCFGKVAEHFPDGRSGLWLHEEDLSVECALATAFEPLHILVTADRQHWQDCAYSALKVSWLQTALEDAAARSAAAFGVEAEISQKGLLEALSDWAKCHKLTRIVGMQPQVGALGDVVSQLRQQLASRGVELCLFNRRQHLETAALATAGFFDFWKKISTLYKFDL